MTREEYLGEAEPCKKFGPSYRGAASTRTKILPIHTVTVATQNANALLDSPAVQPSGPSTSSIADNVEGAAQNQRRLRARPEDFAMCPAKRLRTRNAGEMRAIGTKIPLDNLLSSKAVTRTIRPRAADSWLPSQPAKRGVR